MSDDVMFILIVLPIILIVTHFLTYQIGVVKGMWKSKGIRFLFLSLCSVLFLPAISSATPVSVDEIIYETGSNATNPDLLAGTVDMTFAGATLTIILTNTSTGVASTEASYNLLTGLGFFLPGNLAISSGSVSMAGSTAINFTAPPDNDVSGEWGYDDSPLNAGPFQTVPEGEAYSTVNTVVSAMQSSSKDGKFSSTPVEGPSSLNGPEFGLLSGSVESGIAGGLNAIQNSITISLTLGGDWDGTDLITSISARDIVLSFGSPNASASPVPEPGTMLLLSSGLIVIGSMRATLG